MCCISVCRIHSFLSAPDVHGPTVPHTRAGVSSLPFCAHMCLQCVHIHVLYVRMPLCHGETGGVSIFPSPFFGDNDGHFFFSVTDDRQN